MEFLNKEHNLKVNELKLINELIEHCEIRQEKEIRSFCSIIEKIEMLGMTEQGTWEYEVLKIRSGFQRDRTLVKSATSNVISWLIAYRSTIQGEIAVIADKGTDNGS